MKYKNVKVNKLVQKLSGKKKKKKLFELGINQTQMRHKPRSNFSHIHFLITSHLPEEGGD